MPSPRVLIVGAGVGGLAAAVDLAGRGLDVTVLERADAPGGKLREVMVDGRGIDSGPTVLTMRWVFDELFDDAGLSLDEAVSLAPADVIARHAWGEDERLDLFADIERSVDAIGRFAGTREAQGYRRFAATAEEIFNTLDRSFLRVQEPSRFGLVRAAGLRGLPALWRIRPFATLWKALGDYFHDPRLRQLFGRYSTYVGSSPFQAPATLMLIAHVERVGVWFVEGGMIGLGRALDSLARKQGASFRYGTQVEELLVEGGRVVGVSTSEGERIDADIVVSNADVGALQEGRFGAAARRAVARRTRIERSLSAVTWSMVARAEGFPLHRHNVFFSRDYEQEFDQILGRRRLPSSPTVYICAQDRSDALDMEGDARDERLLCLVNAPAIEDGASFDAWEIETCRKAMTRRLLECGLQLHDAAERAVVTTPSDFARLFPGSAGAIYGNATHGPHASFLRPTARSAIPGLYLAGGSTHPGAGVPMVALSGRAAARAVLQDLPSTSLSRRTDTSGGTSTR